MTSSGHKFLPSGCVPKLTHFLGSPLRPTSCCSGFDSVCLYVCVLGEGVVLCFITLSLTVKKYSLILTEPDLLTATSVTLPLDRNVLLICFASLSSMRALAVQQYLTLNLCLVGNSCLIDMWLTNYRNMETSKGRK